MNRSPAKVQASIPIDESLSSVVCMADYSGGSLISPPSWTEANIGFMVSDAVDGSFVPLCDQAGSLVQISNVATGDSMAYPLPDELFGCHFFQLWSCDSGGIEVGQAAERSFTVLLKG